MQSYWKESQKAEIAKIEREWGKDRWVDSANPKASVVVESGAGATHGLTLSGIENVVKSKELNALAVGSRWLYLIMLIDSKDGVVEMSYKRMGEVIAYSPNAISNGIKELTDAGFIEKIQGSGRSASRYKVLSSDL